MFSPLSESVTATTEESTPGPPTNVRILGCTTTQLKVAWDPPDDTNGVLKGYYVYNGKKCDMLLVLYFSLKNK